MTSLDNQIWREIAILWSVKGYHIFRVRPHPEIPLQVLPDPGNKYDKDAMKVMMPESVNSEFLDKIIREKKIEI